MWKRIGGRRGASGPGEELSGLGTSRARRGRGCSKEGEEEIKGRKYVSLRSRAETARPCLLLCSVAKRPPPGPAPLLSFSFLLFCFLLALPIVRRIGFPCACNWNGRKMLNKFQYSGNRRTKNSGKKKRKKNVTHWEQIGSLPGRDKTSLASSPVLLFATFLLNACLNDCCEFEKRAPLS